MARQPRLDAGNGKTLPWLVAHKDWTGDECLIWPFHRCRGYGMFGIRGEMFYAHRVMCELAHGLAPSNAHHAAHSCGNGRRGCVNPRHLSWKTPSANMLDKRVHGGAYRDGLRRKITAQDVAFIRLLDGIATHDQLATMFGISRRNVGAIIDRKTWRNVA